MIKPLIEQAREFTDKQPWISGANEFHAADQIASFAAKIRDEAVAAEQALERQFICVKCGLRQELGQKAEVNF